MLKGLEKKHENKEQTPCSKNHKASQSKHITRATALEQLVA